MKRIRKIIATPARQLAAEANRSAVPLPDGPAVPEGREPASVVEEPSDEELRAVWCDGWNTSEEWGALNFARAVLARWGHQPAPPAAGADCPACEGVPKPGNQPCAVCGRSAPPAEGEVAEFITQLKSYAEYGTPIRLIPFVIDRAADLLEQLSSGWVVPTVEQVQQLAPPAEGDVAELVAWLRGAIWDSKRRTLATRAAELLEQCHPAPVPVSERLPGPEDEELDAMERQCYLATEVCNDSGCEYVFQHRRYARAVLARFGNHSPDATKMVGPAEGDVAELVAWLRGANWDSKRQTLATRAADLLEGLSSGWVVPTVEQFAPAPAPVPAGMIPVEYWDIDSGARIVSEPSEEGAGGCWIVLNSRYVNPLTEFPTAKAAWDALQQATALPLPKGEAQP